MNTKQIFYALQKNSVTSPFFDGVYSLDNLEHIIVRPQMIVVNTAPSDSKVGHWLVFFCQGSQMDLFDSFGCDEYSSEITNFIYRFSENVNMSNVLLQHKKSNICGILCLYFAYYRCLGYSFKTVIDKMQSIENVLKFVAKTFVVCERNDSCFVQIG